MLSVKVPSTENVLFHFFSFLEALTVAVAVSDVLYTRVYIAKVPTPAP